MVAKVRGSFCLYKYRKIIRVLKNYSVYCFFRMFIVNLHPNHKNMYERKIPVDLDCPLRLTMSLIDSKWKSCILDELRHRPMRPSELHKVLPEATPRVLDLQLRELVEDGLVGKTIYPELPPRSEYAITPLGLTLIPIIDAMLDWGRKNKELFDKKYGGRSK